MEDSLVQSWCDKCFMIEGIKSDVGRATGNQWRQRSNGVMHSGFATVQVSAAIHDGDSVLSMMLYSM